MFNLSRTFMFLFCLTMAQGALSSSLLSKWLDVPEHSFLLELNTEALIQERLVFLSDELKNALANENIGFDTISIESAELVIVLANGDAVEQADQLIRSRFTSVELKPSSNSSSNSSPSSNVTLIAELKESDVQAMLADTVKSNVAVLRKVFVNAKVQPVNDHQIGVGVHKQNVDFFKQIISSRQQSRLEFRLGSEADTGEAFDYDSAKIFLEPEAVVSGHLSSAQVSVTDTYNGPSVMITLDEGGGKKMRSATSNNIGRQMALLLTEYNSDGEMSKKVLMFATVQSPLGSLFNITGQNNLSEATMLAASLNATNLVVPMRILKEKTNN